MTTTEEIIAAARHLTEEKQLRIVDALLASIYATDTEDDAIIERELSRRVDAIERGESRLVPYEDVLDHARRILES